MVAKPVVLDRRLGRAIVALDNRSRICKLLWHGLAFNCLRQFLPLQVHAHGALLAYGTFVRSLHVEVVAAFVQIMATGH